MPRPHRLFAFFAACAAPVLLPAQEAAQATEASPRPFVVITRSGELLEFVREGDPVPAEPEAVPAEVGGAAPTKPEPQVFAVRFSAQGLEIGEGSLPDGVELRASGDPARVLEWLRAPDGQTGILGIGLGAARGVTTLALIGTGASGRDAGVFFQRVLEFPQQIEHLELEGRPTEGGTTAWTVAIRPRQGSWLQRLHTAARPTGAVPHLDPWGDTRLRAAMDPAGWRVLLEPWHALHRSCLRRIERDEVDAMLGAWTEALDGRFALAHDSATRRFVQLIGVVEGAPHAQAMADPLLARLEEAANQGESYAALPGLPDRLVGGIDVTRVGALPQLHGLPEFVARADPYLGAYAGTVGGLQVSASVDRDLDEDGVEALRQLVARLGGQSPGDRLPPTVLAVGRWNVAAWLERVSPEGNLQALGLGGDELPQGLDFELRRSDAGFELDVRTR